MNILETLVKLRDDLKAWVTTNLNALNAKIDEKTIPVDSELNSTSTNPVQNKVISEELDAISNLVGDTSVATQITTAIASQDLFSGDYNDLKNAPNISEDGSGDMVIADEAGNIIFKVDADGAHTTNIELNGTSITEEDSKDIAVTDEKGNVILKVDAEGLHTTNIEINGMSVVDDDTQNLTIADEAGNIIFKVDETGAHTTALTLNGKDVESAIDKANSIEVDEVLSDASINPVQNKVVAAAINELDELIGGDPVAEQISRAIANQNHFSGDYNDLTNAPDITEDGEGNMIIADEAGNIIFQVDENGVNTIAIKIANQDVLDIMDSKIADLVDSSPDTLNTLNELAAALGDDPNFATTVAGQIGGKVDKVNGMGLSETSFTAAEKTKLSGIEEGANKTVVEAMLSSTSESPVQSKAIYAKLDELTGMEPVSSQISDAIEAIVHPVTSVNGYTGTVVLQYEDIKNAPNIYEDSSNELVIADPDGNIIFRSDGAGFETTTLTAKTVKVGTSEITGVDSELSDESTNPVQNKVLAAALKDLDVEHPVTSVNTKTGDVVLTASDVGALPDTTEIPSISGLATEEYVDAQFNTLVGEDPVSEQIVTAIGNIDYPVDSVNGKTGVVVLNYEDIENAPNISEDNSGNLVIADPNGNIIFRSDGDGFETTTITAETVVVGGDNIKEFILNKIAEASLSGGEVDLSGYATVSYVDSKTKVDDAISETSTNPVQNKVVYDAIGLVFNAISQKSQVQIITWEADD